jgi:phenylalanyl-tRNA synthetase beta chain
LKQHPKGKEYSFILENEKVHPLLIDAKNEILSYPPIINSSDLGAVQVGDKDIFVELTGTDLQLVNLAASIMACDMADQGYTIEPVEIVYDYETVFGKSFVCPYYFQEPVFCSMNRVEKFLGEKLTADECVQALNKMAVKAETAFNAEKDSGNSEEKIEGVLVYPPEYRNDFLHAADVMEDIMIGRSLKSFKPERPGDFTIGRLLPITLFSRQVKEILVGMGYQEMIYNYLGSKKDLVDNMLKDPSQSIQISNPMTENYEYVRDSVMASLLASEAVSAHSVYPHKIFEIGKIAYRDESETYTNQYAGFLQADKEANFNTIASNIQALFYYLSKEYNVNEINDTRFIPGRAAAIIYKEKKIGVFGEIHPEVLENWGITVPCSACEINLDDLLK